MNFPSECYGVVLSLFDSTLEKDRLLGHDSGKGVRHPNTQKKPSNLWKPITLCPKNGKGCIPTTDNACMTCKQLLNNFYNWVYFLV